MKNIIVIFQATEQRTESLALALGLGAVQRGADIRLRHLDPSPNTRLAHAGYGTLKLDDLRWAEGIAVILESEQPEHLKILGACISALSIEDGTTNKRSFVFGEAPGAGSVQAVTTMFRDVGVQQLMTERAKNTALLDYMNGAGNKLAEL